MRPNKTPLLRCAIAASLLAPLLPAQNQKPLSSAVEQWAADLGGAVAGPPVPIGPIQAAEGVVMALRSGKIVVFDSTGKQIAEMHLDLEAGSAPVISDGEIFAADVSGSVYCFTREGRRVWKDSRNDRFGGGYNYPVAADLDGDGKAEVILTTERGNLYALDRSGRVRFEIHATNFRLSTPAIGDINSDGLPEIVFADDDGGVYCVNSRGRTLWIDHLYHGRFGRSLPLIADADGDGRYEVYVPVNSSDLGPGLYALDAATGKVLWRAASEMQTYGSTVVADLGQDGRNEILFGDKNTRVYALDPGGRKLWDTQVGGRGIFRAAAVAALSGSGPATIFQVVRDAGADGRSLYALDPSGKILDSMALTGGGIFSPLVCKFRGESDVSLLIAGAKGRLASYRPPQQSGRAKILWAGTRNDAAFSGFVRSARASTAAELVDGANSEPAPAGRKYALRGRNVVTFPGRPANAMVAFRVADPDGATHLNFVQPGEQREEFLTRQTGDYRTVEEWMDPASGRVLGASSITYTLDAAGSEDARQLALFQKEVSALKGELGDHADLADYFSALATAFPEEKRDDRAYWLALLQYVAKTHPQKRVIAEQIANPWPDFDAASFFTTPQHPRDRLAISMLGNEYESAALAVTNLAPHSVTVRIQAGPFQRAHGQPVPSPRVLQIRDAPLILVNSTGRPAEDVLPRLGEGNLLRLDAGETRKVWFTFSSRDLAAGNYQAKLRIGDLLSRDEPLQVPVNLTVHPVHLPDRHIYRHENWLTLSAIKDADLREKIIEDALAHGTNVFIIPEVTISVSRDGKLGEADTALHDASVKRLRGKAIFLVSRSVSLSWPPGYTPDAHTADVAFAEAIRWYAEHMQSLGVGFKDWAFYLWDEPGLTGDDARFRWWVDQVRRVKAADPDVQVYANPAGGARPDMLKPIASFIDIWQPDLALLRGDEKNLAPIFRQKPFWHYEPPGEQRELNPLGYYRMKPRIAYQLGMTGGGYWVYSWSDYWFYDRTMGPEFGTVYPTASGPVTTKRWEASRDGIEDFELLWMLKQAAQKVGGTPGRQALELIDEAVRFVTKGQEHVGDISRKLHPYTPDYFQWMAYRDRLIAMQERLNTLSH